MCFSATASFTSAAIIGSAGIALFALKDGAEEKRWLAALPLIFAFHQSVEGAVWLSFDEAKYQTLASISSYLYTFIAYTFWPIYIPLAIIFYNNSRPEKALLGTLLLGCLVGLYLAYSYIFYHPIDVALGCGFASCQSLVYNVHDPIFGGGIKYAYVVAATVPFFFCKNYRVRLILGPAFLLSFPLGLFLSEEPTFPSIWCVIAALLSVLVFFVLPKKA